MFDSLNTDKTSKLKVRFTWQKVSLSIISDDLSFLICNLVIPWHSMCFLLAAY